MASNDVNLDLNLVIQSFQERINQIMTEVILKDATIRHLSAQLSVLQMENQVNLETEKQSVNKKEDK